MDLTCDDVFEFLDALEKEPILWNLKHNYSRTDMREAWERIQCSLSFDSTVSDLKKKKDSLMAVYRNLRKKIKQSKAESGGSVFKPSWFAYKRMSKFLGPVYDHAPAKKKKQDEYKELILEKCDDPKQQGNEECAEESTVESLNITSDDETECTVKMPSAKSTTGITKRKLPKSDTIENLMGKAHKVLKSAAKSCEQKDECMLYSELLACKLRAFDEYNQNLLMHKIDNIIMIARLQQAHGRNTEQQSDLQNTVDVMPTHVVQIGNQLVPTTQVILTESIS